ncbi:hypothetical protein ACFYYM_31735 [Streptomyces erythrochromogenes]|uniref:hypothetical protein n=1 Tax=Streptomyces erythrochromogenes TaxID=285574 RepID=UPI003678AE94
MAKDLADKLTDEQYEAQLALEECGRVAEKLAHRIGTKHCDDQADQRTVLAVLNSQLQSVNSRLNSLLSKDRDNLQRLVELEQRSRAATGTTLKQIDEMEQGEFHRITQQTLERDGSTTVAAGPKTLEVTCEGVKLKRPQRGRSTDIEAVVASQRIAAERGYSFVLIVRNLRFISQPAHRFSESRRPDVEMIQRFDLERWIEWGDPFDELGAWA